MGSEVREANKKFLKRGAKIGSMQENNRGKIKHIVNVRPTHPTTLSLVCFFVAARRWESKHSYVLNLELCALGIFW